MPFLYRIFFHRLYYRLLFVIAFYDRCGNETLHGRTTDFVAFDRVLIMRFPLALIDHYRKYHNIL